MSVISAGLLLYRRRPGGLEVLLAHPGGPFWRKKDHGAWTIPKGEVDPAEDLLSAARREFEEETGFCPGGPFLPLKPIRQKNAKLVHAWAIEGDFDAAKLKSNSVTIEWPPGSGKRLEFPEIDRAEFFTLEIAKQKINPGQVPLLEELEKRMTNKGSS